MSASTRGLAIAGLALGSLALFASPASAATPASSAGAGDHWAACSTSAASVRVAFHVVRDGSRYGTLRSAQGTGEGEVTDDPAMTVRVRDGYGKVVVAKRTTDGSLSLPFWRAVGGRYWTAEATLENTAAGPCTTPRVFIALR